MLERLPAFSRRLDWFVAHRPDLAASLALMQTLDVAGRRLLAISDRLRLERVLKVMVRAPRADRFQTKLVSRRAASSSTTEVQGNTLGNSSASSPVNMPTTCPGTQKQGA
jgi:hypothetical protein